MTHALYLLDPDPSPAWAPFAGVRPIAELRAGARLIRERWEVFVASEATETFALPHLAGFREPGAPPVKALRKVQGPAVIGSSAFAPTGVAPAWPSGRVRLTAGGATVGWVVPQGDTWKGPSDDGPGMEVRGLPLRGTFDLITALERLLPGDLQAMLGESDPVPRGSTVFGDPASLALHGVQVEPGVIFDLQQGPIVIEGGSEVRAGTRLEGPLWVGSNTRVLGGQIGRASAIGPHSVVRGEMAATVFLGYANKAHDGFVGHTVVGRWVNLGAGTITSNLKNTYGPVRLSVAGAQLDTGRTNLGSLIGDHAKTAIGMLLSTGTVVGAGASVFDGVRPPRYVSPMSWGGAAGSPKMTREGFLAIAARVLPRRDVPFDDATARYLGDVYDWSVQGSR
jgi:UDP-N-acetylglucosamine diphosphorylase/glucosamine-1-phosphate N-acetyltransferase